MWTQPHRSIASFFPFFLLLVPFLSTSFHFTPSDSNDMREIDKRKGRQGRRPGHARFPNPLRLFPKRPLFRESWAALSPCTWGHLNYKPLFFSFLEHLVFFCWCDQYPTCSCNNALYCSLDVSRHGSWGSASLPMERPRWRKIKYEPSGSSYPSLLTELY